MVFRQLNDSLSDEMDQLMKRAEFSARDMAAWLGSPYSTVYQWIWGTVPQPRFYDRVCDRLDVLYFALDQGMFDECPNVGERRLVYIERTYHRARRAKAAAERAV